MSIGLIHEAQTMLLLFSISMWDLIGI